MAKKAKTAKAGKKEGNTIISREVQGKYWAFTWNNYEDNDLAKMVDIFNRCEIEYSIGKEIAPTTGTRHLQGFISCKKEIRATEKFRKIFGDKIHWEKTNGSKEQNIQYTTKEGDFITNIRSIKDAIKINGAYPWQQDVINIVAEEPNDRSIYWFWETTGNKGKTELARHLYLKYGNKMIYVNGKAGDVKCAIAAMNTKPEIVIFGIPRTSQEYMSYSALEEIKDGIFFSGKYESGMVVYPTPHVIVLANFAPEKSKLSADRWKVFNIRGEEEEEEIILEDFL
jgi:hypothetical protein